MAKVYVEYPKALYGKGWDDLSDCVTVHSREEEESMRMLGYKGLSDPTEDAKPAEKKTGRK